MKIVGKYRIPFEEQAVVTMKKGAEIIRIDGLEGALWCWAVIDTEADDEFRDFFLYKTGGEIPEDKNLKYLGCGAIHIQQELMLYVFEEEK